MRTRTVADYDPFHWLIFNSSRREISIFLVMFIQLREGKIVSICIWKLDDEDDGWRHGNFKIFCSTIHHVAAQLCCVSQPRGEGEEKGMKSHLIFVCYLIIVIRCRFELGWWVSVSLMRKFRSQLFHCIIKITSRFDLTHHQPASQPISTNYTKITQKTN